IQLNTGAKFLPEFFGIRKPRFLLVIEAVSKNRSAQSERARFGRNTEGKSFRSKIHDSEIFVERNAGGNFLKLCKPRLVMETRPYIIEHDGGVGKRCRACSGRKIIRRLDRIC